MEYFMGGYFLVAGKDSEPWMHQELLPSKIYTPSACICDLHPDDICLSWVSGDKNAKAEYRNKLGISEAQFSILQESVDDSFANDKYGWIQVFLTLPEAQAYYAQWLTELEDIKLLGIATTAEHREIFLREEKPDGEKAGASGVWLALKRGSKIELDTGFLGFEVLGYELGGFHSFMCNSMEKDFSEKLNIKLNGYGFIPDIDSANRAADYAQDPDIGAESALWQPWAVIELSKTG